MTAVSLPGPIREFFLLERAERQVAKLSDAQRATVREFHSAAQRRLDVARDLRGATYGSIALELYRQACLYLAIAYLTSKGQDIDPPAISPDEAGQKLDAALAVDGVNPPARFQAVKTLLTTSDRLAFERMPQGQVSALIDDIEPAANWLSQAIEHRLPSELKVARVVRAGGTALALLGLLVIFFVWLLAVKNLTRGKPATSSSAAFGSAPEGAVDGERNGRFGFHSGEDESPWLAIDLGKTHTISSAKIYGRGDGFNEQSIPLALEVSDDGQQYRKIAERTEAFSEASPWAVTFPSTRARYVRVRTEKRGYLVLGEVEVYGR